MLHKNCFERLVIINNMKLHIKQMHKEYAMQHENPASESESESAPGSEHIHTEANSINEILAETPDNASDLSSD